MKVKNTTLSAVISLKKAFALAACNLVLSGCVHGPTMTGIHKIYQGQSKIEILGLYGPPPIMVPTTNGSDWAYMIDDSMCIIPIASDRVSGSVRCVISEYAIMKRQENSRALSETINQVNSGFQNIPTAYDTLYKK